MFSECRRGFRTAELFCLYHGGKSTFYGDYGGTTVRAFMERKMSLSLLVELYHVSGGGSVYDIVVEPVVQF